MTLATSTTCSAPRCDRTDVRPYIRGMCCPAHTPAALYGRAEPPTPPAGTTATDLLAAAKAARAAEDAAKAPAPRPVAPEPVAPPRQRSERGAALAARAMARAAEVPRVRVDELRARIEAEPHAYTANGARPTSVAAARAALPRSGTQRARILEAVLDAHRRGAGGACDVELSRHLALGLNSVRPRRLELLEAGLVVDTGHTRQHDGRAHTVWGPSDDALAAVAVP